MSDTAIRKSGIRIVERPWSDVVSGTGGDWTDPEAITAVSAEKTDALGSNPFNSAGEQPVQLIALHEQRVVGRADLFPGRLLFRGNPCAIYLGSDLFVAPPFRSGGLGVALIMRMGAFHHTVAACAFSAMAFPIYRALGWVPYEMPRFVFLRRSRPLLQKWLSKRSVARVLAPLPDAMLALCGACMRLPRRRAARGFTVQEVSRTPAALDERLRSPQHSHGAYRSGVWLDWLLRSSFSTAADNYRRLFVVHDRAGCLVAYFLIKVRYYEVASHMAIPELRLGSLMDWCVFAPDRLDRTALLLSALDVFAADKVDAVEVCSPEPGLAHACKRLGFRRVGATHFMCRAGPRSPFRGPPLQAMDGWGLTPAEGDHCLS